MECILIVPISMHMSMQWYHYTTVEVMSYMSCEVELRQSAGMMSHRDAVPCVAPACCALMIMGWILIVPISMHMPMQWYHYSSEVELRQSAGMMSQRDAAVW